MNVKENVSLYPQSHQCIPDCILLYWINTFQDTTGVNTVSQHYVVWNRALNILWLQCSSTSISWMILPERVNFIKQKFIKQEAISLLIHGVISWEDEWPHEWRFRRKPGCLCQEVLKFGMKLNSGLNWRKKFKCTKITSLKYSVWKSGSRSFYNLVSSAL